MTVPAAEYAGRGRTPVLVIDEAHSLDNAQMDSPVVAQLVGQPTLRHRFVSAFGWHSINVSRSATALPGWNLPIPRNIRHHSAIAGVPIRCSPIMRCP
ncbi:hypothetical protein [Rhodococcus sp. MS16]|uniref:hypothetical protein n=1 Tax=Rhodococcus sp. MS16 TaxID=2579941 RepID=UPI00191CD65C|nr:hypothetical protein [Rhodococcus sp. MS16]